MITSDRPPIDHPEIAEQEMTCAMCPEQYEGRLTDGRYFYLRYRWGGAALGLGTTPDEAVSGTHASAALRLGDSLQGGFDTTAERDVVFAQLLTTCRRNQVASGG